MRSLFDARSLFGWLLAGWVVVTALDIDVLSVISAGAAIYTIIVMAGVAIAIVIGISAIVIDALTSSGDDPITW